MRKFSTQALLLLTAVLLIVFLATTAHANVVSVRFFADGKLVQVNRSVPNNVPAAQAAIQALVGGPFVEEMAVGISSRIPGGTKINKLKVTDTSAEVDLSSEVVNGLDEVGLNEISDQFRLTLGDFPSITAIKLTCGGKVLSSYLPKAPDVGESAEPLVAGNAVGLSGKKICVGASHGRFWNGSGWYWQRSDPCGFGEAVLEDTNSVRLTQFLEQYIKQDGGTFYGVRCHDESYGNHSTGTAWWKMCSQSWLRGTGVPCSVWASYTGNCGADTAVGRGSDDIRCRPLYADYIGSQIYIAFHTNAGGGTGTETFRDTAMEKPAHVANSLTLAQKVQSNIISTIRNTFPGESGWADRGVKDGQGNYGEIRIPNRPAVLVELAFHDHCTRDAVYLKNDFFRSLCTWAMYKGICEYFGNTPTWGKYSGEAVSNTIPASMNPGQSYSVSIKMRNRGVCWMSAYGFKLGAVSGNTPMTTTTLHNVSGTVRPGGETTFTFTMTAPTTPGTYTTAWRMVRDGYEWFGPTVSKTITVVNINDNEAPTVPTNLKRNAVTTSSITLGWTASTDNSAVAGYRIYRNGTQVGTSATNSYTDTGLSANTGYTYQVDAYDAKPNYSAKSAAFETGTGGTWSRANALHSNYVRSGTPDVVGWGGIAVGYSTTETLKIRRGLIQWDMTGAPTQAETFNASNSVRVKLYQYTQVSKTSSANISLYKVNNDWTSSNGTWNNVGIGGIFTGATVACADVGDRTWQWNGNTVGIPLVNRGVYVKNDTSESDANFAKVFDSKDNDGGSGKPPRLEIDYVDLTAPSNCSIKINGGAAYTNSAAVTLTLAATDTLSGLSQMQFSTNGTSYSAAEAFAATKSYTLPAGDGAKTVYAKFKDKVGNWSAAVSATITLDTVPPTISIGAPSVSSTANGPVTYTVTYGGANTITLANNHVTLNKTGSANAGTIAVSGSGSTSRVVTLSDITGDGKLGISIAAGTASDLAGNLAPIAGPSGTFDVFSYVASYGLSNKAAWDSIIGVASSNMVFTLWGKVTAPVNANSFFVDDGSGMPVKVNLNNHGFTTADYVSATGNLDSSGVAPVLNAIKAKKQN